MRIREEVIKEIERTKKSIELEKSFDPNNGELSFYYYLLGDLKDELKEIDEASGNEQVQV